MTEVGFKPSGVGPRDPFLTQDAPGEHLSVILRLTVYEQVGSGESGMSASGVTAKGRQCKGRGRREPWGGTEPHPQQAAIFSPHLVLPGLLEVKVWGKREAEDFSFLPSTGPALDLSSL